MTTIVYPIPLDTEEIWNQFRAAVERFARSYAEFPPDSPCELVLVMNAPDAFHQLPDEVQALFDDLNPQAILYTGQGCDVGSWQHAAKVLPDCFMVCCTTRTYFHRRGWLARLVDARGTFGPGLYTASGVSREGRFHACIRCAGFDSEHFRRYPLVFDSREKGCQFEIGQDMRTGELNPDGSISEWFQKQGLECNVVYWDDIAGVTDVEDAWWECIHDSYRKGDQSNCLVFDKHTDAYAKASDEEKRRLALLCYGKIP